MKLTIFLFSFVPFLGLTQEVYPISLWKQLTPNTIFLSSNFDTVAIANVCENYTVDNKSYKGFSCFIEQDQSYALQNDLDTSITNCDNISFPMDSLKKMNLTRKATLSESYSYITEYVLIKKKKIKNSESPNKFEYTIYFALEVEGTEEDIHSDTLVVSSNKKWKDLSPVTIDTYRILSHKAKIIVIKSYNSYLNESNITILDETIRIVRVED